jgi:nucleotide-binding universal stress UspA family protein
MRILAATDFSTRSNRAVRQGGLLAQACGAELHLLHVVDDDQPTELVDMEKREAGRILSETIASMPELQAVECRTMVVTGDPFDGIVQAATTIQANLIVMGAHRRKLLRDIFVGTTLERVIRTGPFPVLMVNNEAQRRYENVLAPVDMSETSADALKAGHAAGLTSHTRVTLLHAFMTPAKGKMFIGGASQASIDEHVASEHQRAIDDIAAFLVTNGLDGEGWHLRAVEGEPLEVIGRAVREIRPDLLIVGTHGRSGLIKVLIGSVTEELLRSVDVDVLAVPPARRRMAGRAAPDE